MVQWPARIRRPREHYQQRHLRFHLTIAAHPEIPKWPNGVGDQIWSGAMQQRAAGRVELFAACLMPDHLHLLLRPDGQDIIQFLNAWKSWTTKLARDAGHRSPLWQPGMWDRTLRDEADFARTVQYIVDNPAVAKLVERREEWPWVWAWYDDGVAGADAEA
ncbi:MAG: hypothetical protein C0506_04885 [Anaerolinea sp.]|nr:hypothetical protein [Anaerolinea sp.]